MNKIKKYLWFTAGILLLVIAYIGIIVPGIPWSTPCLGATYCFARSSERFHKYMLNHRLFGPFILNWREHRVYPTCAKIFMFLCMDVSLVAIWFATHNLKAVIGTGIFFVLVLIWAARYPGSREESARRKATGKRLGWFK